LHGSKRLPAFGPNDFGELYVVTIPWYGKVKTLRLHYGDEVPAQPLSSSAVPPVVAEPTMALLQQLDPGWTLNERGHLLRHYEFPDFAAALAFGNRIGAIAEEQGHHPDLQVVWGRCSVELWTHDTDGLTEADFLLAKKIEGVFAENIR